MHFKVRNGLLIIQGFFSYLFFVFDAMKKWHSGLVSVIPLDLSNTKLQVDWLA